MATQNHLIFDFGAGGGRAAVARFDGRRFTLDETHRFENRPVFATGTWYWDLLRLFSELKIGIQKSVAQYPNIASLGIDSWAVDFGFLDSKGKLLANPVNYRDERGKGMAEAVFDLIPAFELHSLSGMFIISILSIFHLYAMKIDGYTPYEQAHRFLMMPDLFNYLLTGNAVNEYANATTTVLYNQSRKCWEGEIFSRLALRPEIFQEPVQAGTRLGDLLPSVCRELEVPPIPVVVPATHDTASAVAGIPVGDRQRPCAFLSIGSWGVVGMETEQPVISRAVYEAGFGNEGDAQGGSFLACNINGLFILQQCRQRWIKDDGADISWEQIVRESLQEAALRSFIDVDAPVFGQACADMPAVIADYMRERGEDPPQSRGALARCVYESLVLKFRQRIEMVQELSGTAVEDLHLVGGGIQNESLCQWTADATGITVLAGPIETTAAGNLIMQLKGCGAINSLAEGREIIRHSSIVKEYRPGDKSLWDGVYRRYLQLIG